ncbi:MAG TPA: hypothetical protein VFO76_12430, partial [Candidatus Kapabacteria bacterium]|nr:hypothetical protein [Candidatus Kapabacteria bacterium]
KAGKYGRGAVGKLAMMAYEVVELGEEMMNDEFVNDESRGDEMELGEAVVAPKPLPVVAGGEQLSVRKIKELETVSADGGGVNQLGVNHPPAPLLQKAGEYAVAA